MKNCFLVFIYVYMYVFAYGGHTTAVHVEARRWTPPPQSWELNLGFL